MSNQKIIHQEHFSLEEHRKVKLEIIAKYNSQLKKALWWKYHWLLIKIELETRATLSRRLYAQSH